MNDPDQRDSPMRTSYETAATLAVRLHRHPKTIEHYARTGLLPSYQLMRGGPRLFDPAEVDAALAALRVRTATGDVSVAHRARRQRLQRSVPPNLDVRRIGRFDNEVSDER